MPKKLIAEWTWESESRAEPYLEKTVVSTCEDAEKEINAFLQKFNNDLHPEEKPRKLKEIIEIYEICVHDWHKQNLVSQSDRAGHQYDMWMCEFCGKKYKRTGLDFPSSIYNEVCAPAQKAAEAEFWKNI